MDLFLYEIGQSERVPGISALLGRPSPLYLMGNLVAGGEEAYTVTRSSMAVREWS
jgi:hypothetical protein